MALDDLLKGLAVFKQGVSELAISRATNDAMEALQQAQSVEEQRAVASQLALRLASAGANAAQIEAISGQIAPSASAMFQADVNKSLQEDSQAFQAEQRALDRQLQREGMENQARVLSGKRTLAQEKEIGKLITDYQKQFNKATDKDLSAFQQAQQAEAILKQGNPVGDNTIGMFLARAVQGGSQLSDSEREVFQGSPDVKNKLERMYITYSKGNRLSSGDRQFMLRLIRQLQDSAQSRIEAKLQMTTGQLRQRASRTGLTLDDIEAREMIIPAAALPWTPKQSAQAGATSQVSTQQPTASQDAPAPVGPNPAPAPNFSKFFRPLTGK